MKQERVKNICKEILDKWKNEKMIKTDQIFVFLEGIIDLMKEGEGSAIPKEYQKLSGKLDEMYQYKEYEQMTAADAFVMGSLWSGIKIEERYRTRAAQQVSMKKLVRKYENYRWFLRAIYNNPGINQKDLAKKGKKDTSQLSQLAVRLSEDGLFTCDRVGREKYYYLQERGEQVYDELKKEKREQRNIYAKSIKAISTSNISEEYRIGKGYIREKHRESITVSPRMFQESLVWRDNYDDTSNLLNRMRKNTNIEMVGKNIESERLWENQLMNYWR